MTLEADHVYADFESGNLKFTRAIKKDTLYFEIDGAMMHTRERGEDGCLWKENKLGMAFSEDNFKTWFDLKKKERKYKIGSREYTSYIGEVDTFKKYMLALAMRNGYGGYRQTVLLSDGAPWIWNLREELFPGDVGF
jgi:hypothetical protein